MICSTAQPTASAASGTVGIGVPGETMFSVDSQALERGLDARPAGQLRIDHA